jgi:hypothetical protein
MVLRFDPAVNKITGCPAPGFAHCSQVKSCTVIQKWLQANCTATLHLTSSGFLHRESKVVAIKLVPRLRHLPKPICTMTAKTAPCFAPYGLIKTLTKTVDFADVLRSTQHRLLILTAGLLVATPRFTHKYSIK